MKIFKHNKDCNWEKADCSYKKTHKYCPHPEHACTCRPISEGFFELKQDEETGRLYWYGAEAGWKDPKEIGEDGVLTIKAEHFRVGTVLILKELFE